MELFTRECLHSKSHILNGHQPRSGAIRSFALGNGQRPVFAVERRENTPGYLSRRVSSVYLFFAHSYVGRKQQGENTRTK